MDNEGIEVSSIFCWRLGAGRLSTYSSLGLGYFPRDCKASSSTFPY